MYGDELKKSSTGTPSGESLAERVVARFDLIGDDEMGSTSEQPAVLEELSPRHTDAADGGAVPLARLDPSRCEQLGVRPSEHGRNRTTEEFRIVKRSVLATRAVLLEGGAANANAIMVTSARTKEGKTFTAVNLALSLSREPDVTVLLIDADFTRKSVSGLFSFESEEGLTEALSEPGGDLRRVWSRTDVERLFVVPAGRRHAMSAELIGSRRMQQLISGLARTVPNCVVIFDAAPVLATSEAGALARNVGQVVFVMEADQTTKATAEEAIDLVGACPQVGIVLNKIKYGSGSSAFGEYYKDYAED